MAIVKSSSTRISSVRTDGTMRGWYFPARNTGSDIGLVPTLIFVHATSYCANVYRQMFESPLIKANVLAIDMRGHGTTTLRVDTDSLKSWHIFADDVNGFLDDLRTGGRVHFSKGNKEALAPITGPMILAGHSMGAVSGLMAARARDDIAALALIEPVALPEFLSTIATTPLWPLMRDRMSVLKRARSRNNFWRDAKSVLESYQSKDIFGRWHEGVLEDYLQDGLINSKTRASRTGLERTGDDEEGGVALSCSPQWEAAIMGAQANSLWPDVRALRRQAEKQAHGHPSLHLLVGGYHDTTVPKRARTLFRRYGFRVECDDAYGHLLPMQAPERAARFLADAIAVAVG